MNQESPDGRRVWSARFVLLGAPSYLLCTVTHTCMDGHMAHPPYGWYSYASDLLWISCFILATVLGLKSNLILRRFLVILLPSFCVSRLLLGSLGGVLALLELPLCIMAMVVAYRSLHRPGVIAAALPEAERKQHLAVIRRRLFRVMGGFLAVGLACWAGWYAYQLVRAYRAPRAVLAETDLPFTRQLPAGEAPCLWLTLPDGQRAAVWWEDSVYPAWGERPYREPDRIWQETELGQTSDQVKSYLQMGLDTELKPPGPDYGTNVYSLFSGDYCIGWTLLTNQNNGVFITVRRAKPVELEYLRKRYGQWPLVK